MAVTPPVAPTPPTPPSVPKVTIGGGGSVTESTVPQSGHQTDAERQETEARQAVARGDGALSKTTQERPAAKNAAQGQKENGGQQSGGNTVVQTDPQAAAAMQDSAAQEQAASQQPKTAQTAAAQQPSPLTAQGAGYWGFTFVSVAVLAFVFFRVAMKKRRGGKGELSAEDIRQAMTPVEEETALNLRGLTPDEALRQIEEQEQLDAEAELRKARAEAKQRLAAAKASRAVPVRPSRGESAAAAPKQAAQQYREQVTAMPPEVKAKPKKIVRKPPTNPDEKEHFEISV